MFASIGGTAALTPASARPQQAPEVAGDPCPGELVAIAAVGTPTMCTHGPDPGLTPAEVAAQGDPAPEATAGIQCYGNGTSGERVQVLYVHSGSNRLATLRPRMVQRAAEIDAVFDASAQQTGGHRYVRWLTDAACNLDITAVQAPSADLLLPNFASSLIPRLNGLGFTNQDRKYLIWVDTGTPTNITSGTCSGVGTLYSDDQPSVTANFNNRFGGFTRVDDKCLFAMFDDVGGKVESHELMHTLGAVQASSPNHTPYGHCRDDYDIMCYVDGPGVTLISPRPCTASTLELLFDCNDNDYFSTNPPSGNYLATHWNAADSDWLEPAPGEPQAPDTPQSLAGAPGESSVTLTWVKPNFDGGEPVVGYQVYRNGVLVAPPTTPTTVGASATLPVTTTTPAFADTARVNGTTYNYQVAAVNSVGEGAKTAAVSVMAGVPRPDGQIAPAAAGPFAGDNVYFPSITGNSQTQTQAVALGATVTGYVRVQNDRPGLDSFKVKGVAAGSAGYTVRYFRGTTNITAAVEAGSYTIENLAPGAFVDLKVKITATTSAAAGSSRSATVTIKSKTVKTIKDVVQTRAARS